ncbi:MAG: hypothetical protein AABZ74_15810 [Cyanobacteriota bacterium]
MGEFKVIFKKGAKYKILDNNANARSSNGRFFRFKKIIDLHQEYLKKNCKKEILEDAKDLLELRKVKELEKDNENIPFSIVKEKFNFRI